MITKNQVVSLDYSIKDDKGNTLESSSDGPLTYMHGLGQLPDALEKALEGKASGANVSVDFKPGECFGEYEEELVAVIGPESFDEGLEIEVGMTFQTMTDHGPQVIHVTKIDGDKITIDGNHPYCNMALVWEVTVLSSREATESELQAGSVGGMHSVDGGCCGGDHHHHHHHDHEHNADGGCC